MFRINSWIHHETVWNCLVSDWMRFVLGIHKYVALQKVDERLFIYPINIRYNFSRRKHKRQVE